ncbi:MAG: amino acid adenylation domain-containing protein [Acidobacteriota bacterium]
MAGEAVDPAAARRVLAQGPPRRLLNVYGPTENATFSTWHHARQVPQGASRVPIGRPISNSGAFILDREMRQTPVGVPGELHLSGDGLARCYLGRPSQTAQRFFPHPFSDRPGERLYKSGDLALYLADGRIDCLGRLDRQVKMRGFRVELGEIEAVLAAHPAVRQAVATLRNGRLIGYVAARGEGEGEGEGEGRHRRERRGGAQSGAEKSSSRAVQSSDLRNHLKARLPEYMIPAIFVILDEFPLTPNGKVDRKALPDAAPEKASVYEAPATPAEELLAEIWSEVLEVDRVGRNDHFFELGGHSLLALQALSRIGRTLGADLPVRALFEAPRLADLARRVELARGSARIPGAAPIERAPSGAKTPLSNAQQRLWFLDQLEPGGTLYNMSAALRLRGPLNLEALEEALNGILQRHQALRSRFPARKGKPSLTVRKWERKSVLLEDLSGLPQEGQEEELAQRLRQEARTPFDLAEEPLLRIRLLRLADGDHLLCLTAHHIVFDGWSLGIFGRELRAIYNARLHGEQPRLPELPIQYADYARWQQEWLQGEEAKRQVRYWREALSGAPAGLELPADRPRQARQSHRGRTLAFSFSPPLLPPLRQLCRQGVSSLFMALAAGFQTLLLRCTGRRDVVLGVPLANRDQAEVQGLIGFFVNSLVLRVRLDGNPTFQELLGRVREACLDGYAHQEIPFEKLVEEIKPERSLGQNPIYQVVFGLQGVPPLRLDLEGLEASPVAVDSGASKFDLSVFMEESPQGLGGSAEFSSDLFDTATIRRLLGHFESILLSAVADPQRRLSDLALIGPEQRHQVLVEWNSPQEEPGRDPLMVELFEGRARQVPHALAVVQEDRALSCAELNRRANQLAHQLQALGGVPDEPVGVFSERSLDLIVAFLGIVKAGCAYMPIDPGYPADRTAFLLEDAGAPLLLTQKALRPRLPAGLRQVLWLDEGWHLTAKHSDRNPEPRASASHLAYVIYTSGSTGRPKGTMIQHGALASYNRSVTQVYGISPADRMLQFCSISFDTSIEEIVPALTRGAALVLRSPRMLDSMPVFLGLLQDWSVSIISLPTAFWHEMVDRMEADRLTLPDCLRLVIIAGERAIPDRLAAWLKLAGRYPSLMNTYGLTESTVVSTACNLSSPAVRIQGMREVPLGGPIRQTQLLLLDPCLQPVPAGVPGELFVGGALLARGYRKRPDTTAERFVPNPFSHLPGERLYRTGDLALHSPDGSLEFLGRIDHQVKIRGYRIELGEIEAKLAEHPAVEKAVVMALEDHPGRKRLAAYVVRLNGEVGASRPAAGSSQTGSAQDAFVSGLRGYLEESLPDFMLPSAFAVLEDLPLTPNGKVDRKALAGTPVEAAGVYSAPQTPSEELLAGLWSDLLGVEKAGRDDNFFELGGHSLLATQVVSRLRRAFGVDLAVRTLFEAPTVAALARRIEQARLSGKAAETAPIPAAPRDKPLPLSYAQQRLWLLDQLAPESPLYNLAAALHLKGRLEVQALQASLNQVRRRHEALRTCFQVAGDQPVQVIQEWQATSLPLVDLKQCPPQRREAELQRLARKEARRPFNLSQGPLLRTCLVRLSRHEHVLVASMHHIVSDGWSLGILLRELAALYGSRRRQEAGGRRQEERGRSQESGVRNQEEGEGTGSARIPAGSGLRSPVSGSELTTDNCQPTTLPIPVSGSELSGSELTTDNCQLTTLPIQYVDFACWQRDCQREEVLREQLGYWKEKLQGAAALQLPTDRPRPAAASHRGAVEPFCWPPSLVQPLQALSRRLDATPLMVLLAAFQALLFRCTSQEDITVGTPIANRNRGETEGLIGFFVNMLVMRGHPFAECRFRDLVAQLRETALQAYAHQDVSFEILVDELVSRRDLSRAPLFQVFLAWQDTPLPLEIPGLEAELQELHTATSKFDLSLSMTRSGQGMEGWAEYSTALFDRTTVLRLLAQLRNLLKGAVADPDLCLDNLPLLTDGQRAQVLSEWNDSQADFPDSLCLHQLFRRQAEATAESVAALLDEMAGQGSGAGTLHLSYRELDQRSNRLGHHLGKAGAGAEVVVGLCCRPSLEMIVGLLGTLKSGAAYLPLHPDDPKERLAFILDDAAAPAVLTQRRLLGGLPKRPRRRICLDTAWSEVADEPAEDPEAAAIPDGLAYVIYTSGSTGRPKGVAVDHRAVLRLVLNTNYADLRPDDRVSQASNIAFDVSAFEIWGALLHGACLILIPQQAKLSPQRLSGCLQRQAATVVNLVPSLFNRTALEDPTAFRSVRDLMLAGEALDPELVREVLAQGPPRRLLNVYGPTENATFSTWHRARQVPEGAASVPIGRPISNSRAFVLGRSLEMLPPGVPGEVHLGGKGLARGYLSRPAMSAERFIPHPFSHLPGARLYKTGDLALFRPGGEIEFLGRIDHQVKIRGFRVELGEIEALLGRHPEVSESVVVCRQRVPGEQRLVAYIVGRAGPVGSSQLAVRSDPESDSNLKPEASDAVGSWQLAVGSAESADRNAESETSGSSGPQPPASSLESDPESLRTANRGLPTDLRAFLRRQLPEHMVPSAFVKLESLPLTPNGKVDRRALPDPQPGRSESKEFVAPRNPVEERLASIWSELLGGAPVGVKDDFFEAGGHSLMAFQVTSRLREEFGVAVPLETFFKAPTIAALAVNIERSSGDAGPLTPPPITPLRRDHLRRASAAARREVAALGAAESGQRERG